MPHRHGDPIPRMSENQKRVFRAYGSIPVWLDDHCNIVCTYCNHGPPSCAPTCLLAGVMLNMRNDIRFLDEEDSRGGMPVSPEEMRGNFGRFCIRPDVSSVVSGEQLYEDFIVKANMPLVLQSLGPWMRDEARRYANAGGVHNQPRERLELKCDRAVTLFLRLDLNSLSLEDTVILCNIVESAGVMESFDETMQGRLHKVMDLLSIAHAFREMQGKGGVLKAMLQKGTLPEEIPQSPTLTSPTATTVTTATTTTSATTASTNVPLSVGASSSSSIGVGGSGGKIMTGGATEPRRCHGRTQSGARCKLTELSVTKLHGKCAEAAKPLLKGAKYCKFHRDQEFM